MKTILTVVALSLGATMIQAQTIKESEVPQAVREALKKEYPSAKVEEWEKEGANYEAELKLNKAELSVLYDGSGQLLETEVEIKVSELPKAVVDYVSKDAAGKKIKEASKITDAKGIVSYEVEVEHTEYLLDANGTLIKKEAKHSKEAKD